MIQTILLSLMLLFLVAEVIFKQQLKAETKARIDVGKKLDSIKDYSIEWDEFYEWQRYVTEELKQIQQQQFKNRTNN